MDKVLKNKMLKLMMKIKQILNISLNNKEILFFKNR